MAGVWLLVLLCSTIPSCWGVEVRPVTYPVNLSKGPHWDYNNNVLYFTDILGNAVLRFDPNTGNTSRIQLPTKNGVSVVIPTRGYRLDQFVVTLGATVQILTWDGSDGSLAILDKVATVGTEGTIINDGKADKNGRLWIGAVRIDETTMQPLGNGSLLSLEPDSSDPRVKLTGTTGDNSLTWDDTKNIMYFNGANARTITAFDYNPDDGTFDNERIVFSFEEKNVAGRPEGMAIDSWGNLWIACYGASKVINVDPGSGQLLREIPVPAEKVTSVAFGDANLNNLYVTTSRYGLSDQQLQEQPSAGAVFRVEGLDVVGMPAHTVLREV